MANTGLVVEAVLIRGAEVDMDLPAGPNNDYYFFSPERGIWWMTIGTPSQEILDTYPDDTMIVPDIPNHQDWTHKWENGVFSWVEKPAKTPEELRETMPSLTARQLRLGLINNGILPSQVAAQIALIPDATAREKAETEWEYATTFRRTHSILVLISTQMGLTPEQVDTMWLAAKDL